jgi:hypothetical protein
VNSFETPNQLKWTLQTSGTNCPWTYVTVMNGKVQITPLRNSNWAAGDGNRATRPVAMALGSRSSGSMRLKGGGRPRTGRRYDVVSRSNKFRKPVSLPPTPVDDVRNAIDHHPSPSSLKTALAWFAH